MPALVPIFFAFRIALLRSLSLALLVDWLTSINCSSPLLGSSEENWPVLWRLVHVRVWDLVGMSSALGCDAASHLMSLDISQCQRPKHLALMKRNDNAVYLPVLTVQFSGRCPMPLDSWS